MEDTRMTIEERKAMTLEQKICKIRAALPAIQQKKHSDQVRYKYAKIFDVYEVLTPPMDAYGVNFHIVGEEPTNHTESGDPKYYGHYMQQTQRGERLVWYYEADLIVEWVNADKPDDKRQVRLHAIGTNDGGPDKAKGSAWTYALKYYLFEEFNIDQGDEDPDNTDHARDDDLPFYSPDRPAPRQNAPAPRQAAPQQRLAAPAPAQRQQTAPVSRAAQPQQTAAPAQRRTGLSDAQLQRLYRKAAAVSVPSDAVDDELEVRYGVHDPHQLTREQYEDICNQYDLAAQGGLDDVE